MKNLLPLAVLLTACSSAAPPEQQCIDAALEPNDSIEQAVTELMPVIDGETPIILGTLSLCDSSDARDKDVFAIPPQGATKVFVRAQINSTHPVETMTVAILNQEGERILSGTGCVVAPIAPTRQVYVEVSSGPGVTEYYSLSIELLTSEPTCPSP